MGQSNSSKTPQLKPSTSARPRTTNNDLLSRLCKPPAPEPPVRIPSYPPGATGISNRNHSVSSYPKVGTNTVKPTARKRTSLSPGVSGLPNHGAIKYQKSPLKIEETPQKKVELQQSNLLPIVAVERTSLNIVNTKAVSAQQTHSYQPSRIRSKIYENQAYSNTEMDNNQFRIASPSRDPNQIQRNTEMTGNTGNLNAARSMENFNRRGGRAGNRGRGWPRNRSENRNYNPDTTSDLQFNNGNRNQNPRSQNYNNYNRGGGNRPRGGFFGFKKLEELSQKDPEDTLAVLISNKDNLLNYLNGNELSPDFIVLMFEVLNHVINSAFTVNVSQLLLVITNNKFFEPVHTYIMQLPVEDSAKKNRGRRFWNNYDQFFLNVSLTLDALIEILPATAMDIVPKMLEAIEYTLPNIEQRHRITFTDNVKLALEELQIKMSQLMTKAEEKQRRRKEEPEEEEPPPNDFHDVPVYPTALEITTRVDTYLRKNVVRGAYKDVYHYLDVQYRLLREDFVAPLRDGICEYFEMKNGGIQKKLSNIKIYQNVLCLGVIPNHQQVGYLVQAFKAKTIKNLENSRRFMFGALVCLTADNFTSIIFGKIIDRNKKFLDEGRLVLGFDPGVELEINRSYILVECTIYFEPYYQVLTALQHMNEKHFPLKEYLVDVRTESELPGYLATDNIDHLRQSLNDLNASQLHAFEAAMTKKFCIIQGPPGTGKTYLGLKVARKLLSLKDDWKTAPMLVICYTNHALDQFLEGLLKKTKSLVRIGGQSKNEELQKYNLRGLRVKAIPGQFFEMQRNAKAQLERCGKHLETCGSTLTIINEFTYILNFEYFDNHEVDPNYPNSWFSKASPEELLQWLLYQPNNKDQVKFADYEAINQLIQNVTLQQEEGEEDEEAENEGNGENEDDPMNAQLKQNTVDLDDGDIAPIDYTQTDGRWLLSLRRMLGDITQFTEDLHLMRDTGLENTIEYLHKMQRLIKMRIDYDYVCEQLRMLSRMKEFPSVYVDYQNPKHMPAKDRWLLYAFWVSKCKDMVMLKYIETDRVYRKLYNEFNEVREMIDLFKLKDVDVIGMTTTGAARLHKTLQALKCPIVIVEEAAEVLEAHIITALSPECQHLILIGDHKQLKPSTADYKITRHYNLGVSLFERMVENGLHCHTLNVQHRMRPEIANLVCPSIYPTLENHESVLTYPQVRGIDSPLYFITHYNHEKESSDRSKENLFEAEYLILLARHLALNSYDASRITIIAAYSGQWFLMNRLKKKYHVLQGMRICILDNFQGEENDIILLSLVRNNNEGKNGFLDLENRICVALSRAKHGLYVMGNIEQLCSKNAIWRQVREVFEKYDALGQYLTVRCTNHQENVTHLREINDFQKVPEGGCLKPCEKPLACGHNCAKLCHSTSHENYKCFQPCNKVSPGCAFNHICPDKCFEECSQCMVPKPCTLSCGHSMDIPCHMQPDEIHCLVSVNTKLPCGHETEKPCHADVDTFRCPHPCESRVEPCGHACTFDCHIRADPNHEKYKCFKQCEKSNYKCSMPTQFKHPCQKRCFEKCDTCKMEIRKTRSCGHMFDVPCHEDVDDFVDCKKPCNLILACGHKCSSKCNESCGPCKIQVKKKIVQCGHPIKWECGREPLKTSCKENSCPALLSCGHKCTLPCAKDCSLAKCMELVPFTNLPSPCGHRLQVPCHMRNSTKITNDLLSYCTDKCLGNLKCGHDCPGTCGQCAQGRFHISCSEKCSKILICGHSCATPCVEACKPCTKECEYRCEHSKCTKLCGAPCTKCVEPCSRRCVHQTCRRRCGDECTVPPCYEPCNKILPCGHACVGFCGDPCPPLCRICDKEELTEIIFGTEDEEDARFVWLSGCKHVLESTALETFFGMKNEDKEITVLTCPKCKTPVQSARYKDQIQRIYRDVQYVKAQYFGDPRELKQHYKALKNDITALAVYSRIDECRPVLTYFNDSLKPTLNNKRQDHSKNKLVSLRARLELLLELIKLRYKGAIKLNQKAADLANDYLSFLFGRLIAGSFTANDQQIEAFQTELVRYNRIMQLALIVNQNPSGESHKEYAVCYNQLFAFKKFKLVDDTVIKASLQALCQVAGSGLAVTDFERKQIVAAIGLSPGHWFKCPNGHMYVIGECGGAMQVAKCPECKSQIGGTNHQLLGDNRLAREMAGATHPAYPTINNINLYQLN